jgi:GTP-binding protein
MKSSFYQKTTFLLSAAKVEQLPKDEGSEVAFVGRSNSGKSSVLNALCQQKNLARTSRTPGRTRLLNVFKVDVEHRLIDLPGYGYAKVAPTIKEDWQKNLTKYLEQRQSLRGLIMIMDIRHPLKEYDRWLLDWAYVSKLATHIVLNKSDKVTRLERKKVLAQVIQELSRNRLISVQIFSALKGEGLDELENLLDEWFCFKQS